MPARAVTQLVHQAATREGLAALLGLEDGGQPLELEPARDLVQQGLELRRLLVPMWRTRPVWPAEHNCRLAEAGGEAGGRPELNLALTGRAGVRIGRLLSHTTALGRLLSHGVVLRRTRLSVPVVRVAAFIQSRVPQELRCCRAHLGVGFPAGRSGCTPFQPSQNRSERALSVSESREQRAGRLKMDTDKTLERET